ncbi:hypothetical protein CVV26_00920 [Candidatus Kuenenbacteria bacterium HGW-Kuenenbacteria-1]|uniref:DUF1761 domain-containing protein n=1 Tax=Candidatus Kuenenbacteria bacterium HGW-Kuenenbacteria-1 TaxID=2013812 RepID=A0A2N1UNX0_9BACT|nr:MAG: hypothetical protein CVV26_00920 [Candidatus Kuenenbacteria bacterium HGW-Kuenenbacteria-1]
MTEETKINGIQSEIPIIEEPEKIAILEQPKEIAMIEEPKLKKWSLIEKDKKISLRKVLLAGLVVAIVSSAWGMLTCGWLFNWVYLLEPTQTWRNVNFQDPIFMSIYYVGIFILNFLFTWGFALLYHGIPGEKIEKGIWYGFLIWLVGILPGLFTTYMFINIAEIVIMYWIVNLLIERVIVGIIISLIYKPREIKQ